MSIPSLYVCVCLAVLPTAEGFTTPFPSQAVKQDGVAASTWALLRWLMPASYGTGKLRRSFLELLHTWGLFTQHIFEIAEARLSTVAWPTWGDLGFGADPVLSLFFLFAFSLSLCISCQTVCCFVCSLAGIKCAVGADENVFSMICLYLFKCMCVCVCAN